MTFKMSPNYAGLEDVPIIFSVDVKLLAKGIETKAWPHPSDVFSYNASMEEKILQEYEKKYPEATSKQTFTPSSMPVSPPKDSQTKPTMSDERRPLVSPLHSPAEQLSANPYDTKPNLSSASDSHPSSLYPQSTIKVSPEAMERAASKPPIPPELQHFDANYVETTELYLPDDTVERKASFCSLLKGACDLNLAVIEVLNAFFLFNGDQSKSLQYLRAMTALKELGFPEEEIGTALLLNNNDQELTLDYLMKNV